MNRRDPLPPSIRESITDPAAEAAHQHLSWTPPGEYDEDGIADPGPANPANIQDFVVYTGYPDGTFQVTVTIQRGETVAEQTERGTGELSGSIEDAARRAYEKADRALTVLSNEPSPTVEEKAYGEVYL